MRNKLILSLLLVSFCFAATAAFAGGPLVVDPVTGKAYAYAPGTVPVYYDNGDFAVVYDWNNYPATVTFPNSVGQHVVEKGYHDWSAIPSTSFHANVVGSFASIGLPDINGSNADLVIGKWNGGGVDVIFDADGSVMENFFGVGSNVLGISSPEFGENGVITESWTVLNGQAVAFDDTDAQQYQGVATHEFGHSIGLAHTQTNGAAYFYGGWGEWVGPATCGSLPYSTNLTVDDVETMYPFSNPTPGSGSGIAQANIHTSDDIAAISDLYPGTGWPQSYGTISGKILDVDGKTPLTGVNVIVRSLSDPYTDANSTMSGEWTQGLFGPDGTYTLHGLKPGSQYVVYTDAIFAGGFPTYPMYFLPGPEKFYNGPDTGKTKTAIQCQYQVITAQPGLVKNADIKFDRIQGAPYIYNLGYGTGVTDVTGDGSVAVGSWGRGGPVFRWTAKNGLQNMNVLASDASVFISKNGTYMATNLLDSNNNDLGSYRWDAKSGWKQVPQKYGSCDGVSTYTFGATNDGSVYGLAYVGGCINYQGFRWNPAGGISLLPTATKQDDGTPARSRMNRVSNDGNSLVGWEEGLYQYTDWDGTVYNWISRIASYTHNGIPSIVHNEIGDTMNEGTAVSGDGMIVGGDQLDGQGPHYGAGWRKRVDSNNLEWFGPINDTSSTTPIAMSKDGSVMVGFAGNPWFDWTPGPFIWTSQLGTADLNQFLRLQGANMDAAANNLWTPLALSDDGSVMGGWAYGNLYTFGWVVQMPKVFVCHTPPGNPDNGHTISVAFPQTMNQHLAHGDPVGPCQDYQQ
jgi:hypothetical protein